jgi:hypothetical protein
VREVRLLKGRLGRIRDVRVGSTGVFICSWTKRLAYWPRSNRKDLVGLKSDKVLVFVFQDFVRARTFGAAVLLHFDEHWKHLIERGVRLIHAFKEKRFAIGAPDVVPQPVFFLRLNAVDTYRVPV